MSDAVSDQMIAGWRAWLNDVQPELPVARMTPFGGRFSVCRKDLMPAFQTVLTRDPDMLDWLFPADRYGDPRSQAPVLAATSIAGLFERSWGLDYALREHYVRFLRLLGATVDHHGSVRPLDVRPAWTFQHLTERQTRAIARVLRMLHLLGWQGYSSTGYPDELDFWYDLAFQRWLFERRALLCPGEAIPQDWLKAMDDVSLLPHQWNSIEPLPQRLQVEARPRRYTFRGY